MRDGTPGSSESVLRSEHHTLPLGPRVSIDSVRSDPDPDPDPDLHDTTRGISKDGKGGGRRGETRVVQTCSEDDSGDPDLCLNNTVTSLLGPKGGG